MMNETISQIRFFIGLYPRKIGRNFILPVFCLAFILLPYSCLKTNDSNPGNADTSKLQTYTPDPSGFIAFPGAEGYGKTTTGGKGGKVIYVTNLNDIGPGSFREAIQASGARYILFKVSGTIKLFSPIVIKNGDVTIAGQTSPGDGICVRGNTVTVDADNVIIRFIRFRLGDEMAIENDALNGKNHKNMIIDHCSMSWSVDEAASFYDNTNFTLQWCIISESLYHSVHDKGDHGYGGIWGGKGASFHHNLLSDHTSRNPRFNGIRYNATPELVDFRNNVIYNWGFNSIYGGEGGNQNIVNNYYKPGPATGDAVKYRILDLTQYYYDASVRPDTVYAGKFYLDGNYVEGFPNATSDNWTYGVQGKNVDQVAKLRSKLSTPLDSKGVTTETALDAYNLVLKYAGALLPKRDTVDARVIRELRTGIETYGDTYNARVGNIISGIIDTQASVGGWPELKSDAPSPDFDSDGMPDDWEKSNHLNPNSPLDRNAYNFSNIFTNLEYYLNSRVPEMK